jgi:translation initiation factor IF-2
MDPQHWFKMSFSLFQVTESDIALAKRFDAIIYAFNTAVPAALAKAAEAASVPVRPFNVIYHLVDDLKQAGWPPYQTLNVVFFIKIYQ